jgi:chromate transporter
MATSPGPLHQSLPRLFVRFLRFGAVAWGGPVAQIAVIREELVERERWVSRERFNRVLAVYQALPGPEATELCVYFGHLARGRLGGLLAGLGFLAPGLGLMLAVSWAYVRYGTDFAPEGLFYGFAAAVLALIVRGVITIGRHALTSSWLWAIAVSALAAQLAGAHVAVVLVAAGLVNAAIKAGWLPAAGAIVAVAAVAVVLVPGLHGTGESGWRYAGPATDPSLLALLGAGLMAGLLTFGGAYTAIPLLRGQAVVRGGWVTNAQFLDALALSGVLPAPLIIFGTFIGYVAAGLDGALVMTAGIFLPAFSFTLVGHRHLERLVEEPRLHAFLDGVTAGVVGVIAATAVELAPTSIPDVAAGVLGAGALALLLSWSSRAAIPVAVLGAGALGTLIRAL